MARGIHSVLLDPDTRLAPAREALKGVNTNALDKALQKMVADAKELGPQINQYLRSANEFLVNMSALGWGCRVNETDIKTLAAHVDSPHQAYEAHFLSRDTSKLSVEHRLPPDLLSPKNLEAATRTGLLTKDQTDALKFFFFGQGQQPSNLQHNIQPPPQGGEGGNSQNPQQGSQQNQEEENEEEDFQIGGGSTLRKGMNGPAGSPDPAGAPPPAPPLPPYGSGSSTSYDQFQNQNFVQKEENYLNANFSQNDPTYGWFQSLFASENWYREFAGKGLSDLQKIREAKQQITMEMSGVDVTTPQGAKKLYLLQQKLGDVNQSEREIMSDMQRAQQANNERKELIKGLLEIQKQTVENFIRNVK